jgi:hypothetical protein
MGFSVGKVDAGGGLVEEAGDEHHREEPRGEIEQERASRGDGQLRDHQQVKQRFAQTRALFDAEGAVTGGIRQAGEKPGWSHHVEQAALDECGKRRHAA